MNIDNNTNWRKVSLKPGLSEDYIREFQDKVNWNEISYYQVLSENFMREFQDRLM